MSTGVGPIGFYSSIGGGRRGGSSRGAGSAQATYQRQLATQQRQTAQARRPALQGVRRQEADAIDILNAVAHEKRVF